MHDWPGNIRELRNVVQYAIALGRKPTILTPEDLPPSVRRQPAPRIGPVRIDLPYQEAREQWLRSFQEHYITQLLEAHGGNVSAAARAAGMDRRTLQRIVAHWGAAHSPSSKSGYGGS